MAKQVGVKLPEDVCSLLKLGTAMGVLSTFSEKGLPDTLITPYMYPKGTESILLSVFKEHSSYHNLVWQKKVSLSCYADNDIAYTILGRAGVVRAPSSVHPLMNIVRVDIIDIRCDKSSLIRIDSGIRWSYSSPEAEELGAALMAELQELARTL